MAAISAACSTALGDSIWMMPMIRGLIEPTSAWATLAEAGAARRQREPSVPSGG